MFSELRAQNGYKYLIFSLCYVVYCYHKYTKIYISATIFGTKMQIECHFLSAKHSKPSQSHWVANGLKQRKKTKKVKCMGADGSGDDMKKPWMDSTWRTFHSGL